jgi:PhnB protein
MAQVKAIPEGREGQIPHLVVNDAPRAIAFYAKAFGAEETMRLAAPDGRILHAELRVGPSLLFVADDFPEMCGGASHTPRALKGTPVSIHRYVEDVDAVIRRAAAAGATVKMPATEMFWGDRYGVVEDPFGHQWAFATHVRDASPEEMARGAATMLSQGKPTASATK